MIICDPIPALVCRYFLFGGANMRRLIILMASIIALLSTGLPGSASATTYSVGFNNPKINISSPQSSGTSCNGALYVNGSSNLDEVWFCIRNPQRELTTARADVQNGAFDITLNLCMGPGEYTIWAGDNPQRFDGSIRFLAYNQNSEDSRYTAPSVYVDSDNESIVALAKSLAPDSLSDREKLNNIHNWVTSNISYDTAAYARRENILTPASDTLSRRTGMCRDYSFLTAALARASGLPARVIYGEATDPNSNQKGMHAWNEVLVDGQWIFVDTTWDAGYVSGNKFVFAPSSTYLLANSSLAAGTHRPTSTQLY